MEMYAEEGDIQRSIQTAIRVAAYQYAEYTEMTVRLERRGHHYYSIFTDLISCVRVRSIRLSSPGVSSNWDKSTGMPKFRSHFLVWGSQNPFSKLWMDIFVMERCSRSRAMTSDY